MSARFCWASILASWFIWSSACAHSVQPPVSQPRESTTIYVVRRGWHVDVGFAASDMEAPLIAIAAKFPGVRYLFFGFGDRRYLMAHHHVPAMAAALWPGRALILITGLSATPGQAFGDAHVVRLRVSVEQSRAAQDFIWSSMAIVPSPTGDPTPVVERGPYEGSLYFSARAPYSAFHTCNTWAAEVLRGAGLPVRTSGVLFAGQIWKQTRKLAAAE
jgi:hypothetical protein